MSDEPRYSEVFVDASGVHERLQPTDEELQRTRELFRELHEGVSAFKESAIAIGFVLVVVIGLTAIIVSVRP